MKYSFVRQPIASDHGTVAYELLVRGVGEVTSETVLDWACQEEARIRKVDMDALELAIALAPEGIPYHVNVNKYTINNPAYFARLGDVLLQGIDPHVIRIEVSEKIEPTEQVRDWLFNVRSMGFFTYLDDFGNHHSNNLALTRLRPNGIKIEGEIVKGILKDDFCIGLIETDLDFCRRKGLDCIAEHVENSLILGTLKDICDRVGYKRLQYQGWHFGKGEPVGGEY